MVRTASCVLREADPSYCAPQHLHTWVMANYELQPLTAAIIVSIGALTVVFVSVLAVAFATAPKEKVE